MGRLQEKLTAEIVTTRGLYQSLDTNQLALNRANAELRDHSENLEQRVQQRTVELEESKTAIEDLKKKVETALYSTMDSSVVNLMIEGRLRNEKRAMSVMFSDLVGFTSYSETTPPENVVAVLNRYLESGRRIFAWKDLQVWWDDDQRRLSGVAVEVQLRNPGR